MRNKKYWTIGLVAACVAIAMIVGVALRSGARQEDNKAANKVTSTMTSTMKTICVGRFLIDIPEGSAIDFSGARMAGIEMHTWPAHGADKLQADIARRVEETGQEKNEYDAPGLEKNFVADAINFKATVLYYGRQKPLDRISMGKKVEGTEAGINIEAFGLHGETAYHFKGERLASPRSENNVLDILKKFEARPAGELPAAPGFCVEDGLVHDPVAPAANESITMFASLKGHPDVAIRLDTSVNTQRIEQSLLVRDANNKIKRTYAANYQNFQKRVRSINGIDGEEVLDKVKEPSGTSAHMFVWASMGKLNDVLAPKLTLELESGIGRPGETIDASLSDAAILALWEQISSSVRLRPVAGAASAKQALVPDKLPLDTLAATDSICPQTGYWECNEAGDIKGGKRQFFSAGEPLPHAVLLGPPSMMNRLRGQQPTHLAATVWKLVGYDGPGATPVPAAPDPDGGEGPAEPDGTLG